MYNLIACLTLLLLGFAAYNYHNQKYLHTEHFWIGLNHFIKTRQYYWVLIQLFVLLPYVALNRTLMWLEDLLFARRLAKVHDDFFNKPNERLVFVLGH